MNCREVQKDLIPFAEGDIDDLRSERVRSHLETCDKCRGDVRSIDRTLKMAVTYRIPELSEAAAVRMLRGIRARLERRRSSRPYRLILALGISAAVLVLSVVGLRHSRLIGGPGDFEEVNRTSFGGDWMTVVSGDADIFQEVMERLAALEVQEADGAQSRQAPTGLRVPSKGGDAERVPLWEEFQGNYFRGYQVESLLMDLDDQEMDRVLEKVEERLSV